jgi:predicted transcriptional regulator
MSERWRSVALRQDCTIGDTAEFLTRSSFQIVLVVDEKRWLLGNAAIGNIGRVVLPGGELTDSVAKEMNRTPVTIEKQDVGKRL